LVACVGIKKFVLPQADSTILLCRLHSLNSIFNQCFDSAADWMCKKILAAQTNTSAFIIVDSKDLLSFFAAVVQYKSPDIMVTIRPWRASKTEDMYVHTF
jgi:hypothetical protein